MGKEPTTEKAKATSATIDNYLDGTDDYLTAIEDKLFFGSPVKEDDAVAANRVDHRARRIGNINDRLYLINAALEQL